MVTNAHSVVASEKSVEASLPVFRLLTEIGVASSNKNRKRNQ
jgi:hypothetical protein